MHIFILPNPAVLIINPQCMHEGYSSHLFVCLCVTFHSGGNADLRYSAKNGHQWTANGILFIKKKKSEILQIGSFDLETAVYAQCHPKLLIKTRPFIKTMSFTTCVNIMTMTPTQPSNILFSPRASSYRIFFMEEGEELFFIASKPCFCLTAVRGRV